MDNLLMLRRRAMIMMMKQEEPLYNWVIGRGFYVNNSLLQHIADNDKRAAVVTNTGDHYIQYCPDGTTEASSDYYPIPLPERASSISAEIKAGMDIWYNIYSLSWDTSQNKWRQQVQTGWVNSGDLTVPSGATHWVAAIKMGSAGSTVITEEHTSAIKFNITVSEPPEPGDNLYDPTQNINNYYIDMFGNPSRDNTCSYTGAIPVGLGKTYTFEGVSSKAGTNNKRLLAYSSTTVNHSALVGAPVAVAVDGIGVAYSVSITIRDSAAKYIRASFNTADTDISLKEDVT